tara:strand:+ start:204 stop:857 length:654 start_codon:yes stop_codon:yes gene_type:complete
MTTPTPENLQRRLRRVVTQGRSRLGPRHDLFEPGLRSNMNFIETPLPSNSNNNVDPITHNKFKVGNEAVEYGTRKKRYMTLNSFKNYIKPRTLPNGTELRKSTVSRMRTIYNTPPNSNSNMEVENLFTREKLKRKNIRFVRFTEPSKILGIKSAIKQLEKELNALRKTNTRPKILKTDTPRKRTTKYNNAVKESIKLEKKIENKKKAIKKLKEKLKA